jgi:hypothetical protein
VSWLGLGRQYNRIILYNTKTTKHDDIVQCENDQVTVFVCVRKRSVVLYDNRTKSDVTASMKGAVSREEGCMPRARRELTSLLRYSRRDPYLFVFVHVRSFCTIIVPGLIDRPRAMS